MNSEWHNFHKERPNIVKVYDEIKYSEQVLFCINDKLYLGYYISEYIYDADKGEYEWLDSIELGMYSLISLIEDYLPVVDGSINCDEGIEKYDIYWSKIDILDILLNIDLLKKKEKENG